MGSITADSVVIELEAKNAAYDAAMRNSASVTDAVVNQIVNSCGQIEAAIRKQTDVIEAGTAKVVASQTILSNQVAMAGRRIAGGENPFKALAESAPELISAIVETSGKAGGLAALFAGPWGIAISAAASVVGLLVAKLFSAEDAHQAVAKAADTAADAERELQAVLGGTIQSSERARIASLDRANASRLAAIAAVNEAKAQLSLANALAQRANAEAVGGRALNYGAQGVAIAAKQRADDKQVALQSAQRELNALEIRVRNLQTAATMARGIEAKQAQDKDDKKAAAERRKAEAEAKRAQSEAERAAKDEARHRRAAANEIARSSSELLAAEADLTSDTVKQDEVLRQRIRNEQERAKADIDANPIYTAKEREKLKAIEDQIAQSKLNKVALQAGERMIRDELRIREAGFDNERDQLQIQGDLANTAQERRDVALRLVDLAYQRERAELDAVLASKTSTDAEKEIARRRLAMLGTLQEGDRSATSRRNEGPLADYRRQFQDIDTAIEQVEANAMRKLEESLTRATVKTLGLKGALGDVVGQLIQIGIQRQIIGPLADALFGPGGEGASGGGVIGGIITGLGRFFSGGRASGGPVAGGQIYRINEGASPGRVEGFRPQGSGTIIPLGQMNAIPRQSAQQPVVIQITADEGAMFVPRVQQISGDVSIVTVRQAAPQIVQAATANTMAQATRPRL